MRKQPLLSRNAPPPDRHKRWFETPVGIEAKGVDLGLGNFCAEAEPAGPGGDPWGRYRHRVFVAAGLPTLTPDAGKPGIPA